MKDSRLRLTPRHPSTDRCSPVSVDTTASTHQTRGQCAPECQEHPAADEALLNVSAAKGTRVSQGERQRCFIRERADRTTGEDKIRRVVDSWSAEERATMY